jgi:hypothetical protein
MSVSIWETLVQRRKISGFCALFEAYSGERAWKAIGDRLQGPCYLSRMNMIEKLGPGNKEHISGNISLQIGPSKSGNNYLQRR